MRTFLRAGVVVIAVLAACKDSPAPVDFADPAAITANLGSVDSAFDSDVYRSFAVASASMDPAVPAAALHPAAQLLRGTLPGLNQAASPYILTVTRAQRLQALAPEMSVAAAAGRIIPDSM